MREFSSSAELVEHYRRVRRRIDRAALPKMPWTEPVLKQVLPEWTAPVVKQVWQDRPRARIIAATCAVLGVDRDLLMKKGSRRTSVVDARRCAATLMRENGDYLSSIGDALNRDHSAICYLMKQPPPPEKLEAVRAALARIQA